MDPSLRRFAEFWLENERRSPLLRRLLLCLVRRRMEVLSPHWLHAWSSEKYQEELAETMDFSNEARRKDEVSYCLEDCERVLRGMSLEALADLIDHQVLTELSCPMLHDPRRRPFDRCRYLQFRG
jgi:hypothetical protein